MAKIARMIKVAISLSMGRRRSL